MLITCSVAVAIAAVTFLPHPSGIRPPVAAGDLVDPVITDCLPPGLDLLDPFTPSNPINGTSSGFTVVPIVTRTANGCGRPTS